MKAILTKIFLDFLARLAGKKKYQAFFESLYHASLNGMNYGNGGELNQSGELGLLMAIKKALAQHPKILCFDVGANLGDYSKALIDIFGEKATIHAFEPSKKTFQKLIQNIGNRPKFIANNFGFSDTQNTQILYTNQDESGLASIYQRKLDHFGINMDKQEEISLTTIDQYCQENKIDKIDFLKLDIEGNELKALEGAKQMLQSGSISLIQFEFGGCNIDSKTYFQNFFYLLKDHYRIFRIVKDGIQELSHYRETQEIFITVNYFAIKKDISPSFFA